ncbi:MAG TPA: tetratricopeptide repeat protein [Gemmatimonadales bacterium]|nr:tetratricopeptide repeat protein [Gemmatimonadales bacterium]
MAEPLHALQAELERDPASLAFLQLAEKLRIRGDLDSAARVALAGLEHHPNLADAHDAFGRILTDAGDFERAADEWGVALALNPRHGGAHKGLGFLEYRRGDLDRALDHLELALAADPTDRSVIQALQVVRSAAQATGEARETARSRQVAAPQAPPTAQAPAPAAAPSPAASPALVFAGFEGGDRGMLLLDPRGRTLAGGMRDGQERDVGDEVAAYLAGVSQEAERTARLLELGQWRWIAAEAEGGTLHLSRPAEDALLLLARDRSVPAGRMGILAARAADVARRWLEAQRV